MSINSAIKLAITQAVNVCVPDLYTGAEKTYCTFNYTEYPAGFSNNAPKSVKYDVQVHLFLPVEENPLKLRDKIKNALFMAGFTFPTILNMTDNEYQHHVFECEYEEEL